jgi:hypothetical protein
MKEESQEKPIVPVQRLCSEIQLFDLCDLDSCKLRKGRFCTNEELLGKFEAIKEKDETPDLVYDEDELLSDDESDFDEYDEESEHEDE